MLCITFPKNIARCSQTIFKKTKKFVYWQNQTVFMYKIILGNFKDSKLSL